MCHSSERWTFWSHRQAAKTETVKRKDEAHKADSVVSSVESVVSTDKEERIQPEKELERAS